MSEKESFIKHFWKEKKMVGAMAPSSRFLAKKMLKHVDFENARVLVELGPGTGVFTEEIIKSMNPEAILLVFELNEAFSKQLVKRFTDKRVHIIHDSADQMEKYLAKYELEKADAVISSLPLANFPGELRTSVLSASHNALKDNGTYIQFQYSLQSKKYIKRFFKDISLNFALFNFPPAFVYTCRK